MKRVFWLTVGAGLGAWSLHKVQVKTTQLKRSLTPQSIAVRTGDRGKLAAEGTGNRVRTFAEDVREGMREREAELRAAVQADLETPDARDPAELRAQPRRRIVRARYTIIDNHDDKDGH